MDAPVRERSMPSPPRASVSGAAATIMAPTLFYSPLVKELQELLDHELRLASQTRQCHWNVKGSDFLQLHELFGKQYDDIDKEIDKLAEFIVQINTTAVRGDHIRMDDRMSRTLAKEMVSFLAKEHDDVIQRIQNIVTGTTVSHEAIRAYLGELQGKHMKMKWFLSALLATEPSKATK